MNKSLKIKLLKKGMLTIQDLGRIGFQHLGVPIGGYADRRSASLALSLVGLEIGSPIFEITYGNCEIQFLADCQVAVTGAENSLFINDKPAALNQTINVMANDRVRLSTPQSGLRNYLALRIQWEFEKNLNSVSPLINSDNTFIKETNSEITLGNSLKPIPLNQAILTAPYFSNSFYDTNEIRIFLGPEWDLLTKQQRREIQLKPFTISSAFNRMGLRLKEKIIMKGYNDMYSSGIIPGVIQWNPKGELMILFRDAQTIGGYPRIACIFEDDLDIIAQKKAGDPLVFRVIDYQ